MINVLNKTMTLQSFDSSIDDSEQMNFLIHQVSRTPTNLGCHYQRIYHCFTKKNSQHLQAALADLLIILNGKGKRFSSRMISGSSALLDDSIITLLKQGQTESQRLSCNRIKYSVFTQGLIGTTDLIKQKQQSSTDRDVLVLANEYIEYSQLDEAMGLLEQSIEQDGREELQQLLLDLYQATEEKQRFNLAFRNLQMKSINLIARWDKMNHFFNERSS